MNSDEVSHSDMQGLRPDHLSPPSSSTIEVTSAATLANAPFE